MKPVDHMICFAMKANSNLSVVRTLCDQVAVLSGGEIVEKGATEAVFALPQHPYTRKLLESVPLPDVEAGWIMAGTVTTA